MMLTATQKRRAAHLLTQLEKHKEEHPLYHAELWDNPAPQTSQRRCVEALDRTGLDVIVALGGNGSGKSEVLMQLAMAVALGRNHPDARRWALRNGLPLWRLPEKQGRVILSSLTHPDSRKVLRPKADRYAPPGARWRHRYADNEAELLMPGSNGQTGVIIFKAAKQGREAYQGDWAHMWGYDEEHPEDVFKETQSRHTRPECEGIGFHFLSMTPLKGVTWVARKFIPEYAMTEEDGPGELSVSVHWLHTEDSPHATEANLRVLSSYGTHEREARTRGVVAALEGRVYDEFDRTVHVIPGFLPPPAWPRLQSIDWGTSNPCAIIYVAIDPRDRTLHVYRERHKPGETPRQHAEWVIKTEAEEREALELAHPAARLPHKLIKHRIADPEDLAARRTWAMDHDLDTIAADKSIREGINDVKDVLRLDARGRPHLFIHDTCPNTIGEIMQYVWDEKNSSLRDDPDMPRKKNDHAMDALRYLVRMAKILGL